MPRGQKRRPVSDGHHLMLPQSYQPKLPSRWQVSTLPGQK